MTTPPEDTPSPQWPRSFAVPAQPDDMEQFFDQLRNVVHEVVRTDITEVEAAHLAAEQHKRKLSIKLDLCVLPLAIAAFVALQMMDLIIFAEAAGLVPNFGILVIRMIRGEFF